MTRGKWFLPDTPDLLGMLGEQTAVTVEGMEAFSRWASGDAASGDAVRAAEHRADDCKRALQRSLRAAFVTAIDPEDLFTLSRDMDWIINRAKDCVGESEVMACPPDTALSDMAALLAQATRDLALAIARLGDVDGDPAAAADAAVKSERRVEHVYRRAMGALLEEDDLREMVSRQELYRRCSAIGESVVNTAERVAYAVIKET